MNDTAFYIVGIGMVVCALVVSFVGLRFKTFPGSGPALLGVIALFVLLVAGTTTFAWRNAVDEQETRAEEGKTPPGVEASGEVVQQQNTPADTATGNPAEATTVAEGTSTTSTTSGSSTTSTTTQASTAEGSQLFESQGCTGCHTLAAAGSTATVGPVLDDVLKGKPKSFISESITDPNAEIAKGYPPNVMPQTFSQSMSPDELSALVAYLYASVNK
ncbi:MAG: c-type cytochrome [Solirubrobacterales bacterium]